MRKAYLKTLKIHEGCFSKEKGVVIADYSGEETSGFFENEHIKNKKLEVVVLEKKGEIAFVKLPGRTIEGAGDKGYLSVKKLELEYAA